jgi:aspartyl protease family protein
MIKNKVLLALAVTFFASQAFAETRLNVVGLFSGKALVSINGGTPESIAAGQTSESATFMVEGKRQTLKMGQAASVAGAAAPVNNNPVSLYADSQGHFSGNLSINGASLKYLVDTGASTVALNSGDAKFAKIDYEKGEKAQASTANGVIEVYLV